MNTDKKRTGGSGSPYPYDVSFGEHRTLQGPGFAFHRICVHLCSSVVTFAALFLAPVSRVDAQAPDVPIYRQGRNENRLEDSIQAAAKQLFSETNAVKLP